MLNTIATDDRRRKDFFQGEANGGFSRGGQKDICRGAEIGKISF